MKHFLVALIALTSLTFVGCQSTEASQREVIFKTFPSATNVISTGGRLDNIVFVNDTVFITHHGNFTNEEISSYTKYVKTSSGWVQAH